MSAQHSMIARDRKQRPERSGEAGEDRTGQLRPTSACGASQKNDPTQSNTKVASA